MASLSSAGCGFSTGTQVPDSIQGVWFVPTFGQLSEEQIRAVHQHANGAATTTTYASYFVTVALALTLEPASERNPKPYGTVEFNAGIFSSCVYNVAGDAATLNISASKNEPFGSVVLFPAGGGDPVLLEYARYKEPVVNFGDTVLVGMSSGGSLIYFDLQFWNLTNFQNVSPLPLSHFSPDTFLAGVDVFWGVSVDFEWTLADFGNYGRTFCDRAWCKIGKKTRYANQGKSIPLTFAGKILANCTPVTTGVLRFECVSLGANVNETPTFG
jgi:hypothetical protein